MTPMLLFGAPGFGRKALRAIRTILLFALIVEGIPRLTYQVMKGQWEAKRGDRNALAIDAPVHRAVPGQPAHYSHTIYLFGNSALYGYLMTDEDAISGQLQAMLPDARVVNRATWGANISQELLELEGVPLAAGDVVIFYDGAWDLNNLYTNPAYCSLPLSIVMLYCRIAVVPALDTAAQADNLRAMDYALAEARRLTANARAQFIHIWQPMRFRALYHDIDAAQTMIALDPAALDWTTMLGAGDAMFDLDFVHTTAAANVIIARAMVAAMCPLL
jgi:hypothetical protein